MTGVYSARVRRDDLVADQGIMFRAATLVENYNRPDMLIVKGRQSELRDARVPGYGLLLADETGDRCFSGLLTSVEETGDGACHLIYTGDLVRFWWRICYPVPANDWTTAGQSAAYDTIDDDAETKLLYYLNRNAGPGARTERRIPTLTLPASAGRGPTGVTSARFNVVGQLAGLLAESADLRLEVRQVYPGGSPTLTTVLTAVPDLSLSHRFGTAKTAPLQVGAGWKTRIEIPLVTTALSAAGGELADRILTKLSEPTAEALWKARVEGLVDQRNTTDASEIQDSLVNALIEGAGPTEVSAPLPDTKLARSLPIGSKITLKLGNAVIVDRLRQRTTELNEDGVAKKVTAVFGDPDAGVKSPDQRALARERRRVQNLERR